MTTYDVHAHCIRDRVRLAPFRSILTDLEAGIRAMDDTGVDVQLLAGWIDLTGVER